MELYPRLVVVNGKEPGRIFPLPFATTVLGRSSGVGISLRETGISRHHARFMVNSGKVKLEDLKSTNGSYLNGRPVTTSKLQDGDNLQFGSCRLVFRTDRPSPLEGKTPGRTRIEVSKRNKSPRQSTCLGHGGVWRFPLYSGKGRGEVNMRAAVLVIDMVKDTLQGEREYPVTPFAKAIVPQINQITDWARSRDFPVVFACDSFLEDDFIFKGKMKPHSLRDTPGSEVADLLDRKEGDVFLPKRRFSAFFKTDLDQTLRNWKVETVIVCGIATHFCVLMTAMDALCNDFKAVIIEDASASYSAEVHSKTLELYRKNPLFPLLQVLKSSELNQKFGG